MSMALPSPDPRTLGGLPFVLLRIPPPYRALEPIADPTKLHPADVTDGVVLALQILDVTEAWGPLTAWAPRVRRAFLTAPVVLWIRESVFLGAVHIARLAGNLHVRGSSVAYTYDEKDGVPEVTMLRVDFTPDGG